MLLLLGKLLALDQVGCKCSHRRALGLPGARQARRRCNLGGRRCRSVAGVKRRSVGSVGTEHNVGGGVIVYLAGGVHLYKGVIGGERLGKRAHGQRARHHREGYRGNSQAAAKRSNSSPPHGRSFLANQKSSSVIVAQKQSER